MATLAEQLENLLQEQGTTIPSGTLSSANTGTNQLSWLNTFDKIQQEQQLKPGEGLPTVPQGVPASTFYRQATQIGAMPSGASQFFVKPLAPETPTYNFAQATSTPAQQTPISSTSSSQQQISKFLEEAELNQEQFGDDSSAPEFGTQMETTEISNIISDFFPNSMSETKTNATNLFSQEELQVDVGIGTTLQEDIERNAQHVWSDIKSQVTETYNNIVDKPGIAAGKLGMSVFSKLLNVPTAASMAASTLYSLITNDTGEYADSLIGRSGIVNGTEVPDADGNFNPESTTISGWNSLGMAIDSQGNLVLTDDGFYIWDSMSSWRPTISDKEAREISRRDAIASGRTIGSDDTTGGYDTSGIDISDVGGTGDPETGSTGSGAPSGGTDPQTDDDSGMNTGDDSSGFSEEGR